MWKLFILSIVLFILGIIIFLSTGNKLGYLISGLGVILMYIDINITKVKRLKKIFEKE